MHVVKDKCKVKIKIKQVLPKKEISLNRNPLPGVEPGTFQIDKPHLPKRRFYVYMFSDTVFLG